MRRGGGGGRRKGREPKAGCPIQNTLKCPPLGQGLPPCSTTAHRAFDSPTSSSSSDDPLPSLKSAALSTRMDGVTGLEPAAGEPVSEPAEVTERAGAAAGAAGGISNKSEDSGYFALS